MEYERYGGNSVQGKAAHMGMLWTPTPAGVTEVPTEASGKPPDGPGRQNHGDLILSAFEALPTVPTQTRNRPTPNEGRPETS